MILNFDVFGNDLESMPHENLKHGSCIAEEVIKRTIFLIKTCIKNLYDGFHRVNGMGGFVYCLPILRYRHLLCVSLNWRWPQTSTGFFYYSTPSKTWNNHISFLNASIMCILFKLSLGYSTVDLLTLQNMSDMLV